jgi:hypothetical protein
MERPGNNKNKIIRCAKEYKKKLSSLSAKKKHRHATKRVLRHVSQVKNAFLVAGI